MIKQIYHLTAYKKELSQLLTECVNEGASINFLAPLTMEKAEAYWDTVDIKDTLMVFVAMEQEKLVGSVQLVCSEKENGRHRAEIAKVMVHPTFRGRGYAMQLLKEAERAAVAKGITVLVLDTEKGSSANELYKKLNYTFAGTIPQFAKSARSHQLEATNFYYKQIGSI